MGAFKLGKTDFNFVITIMGRIGASTFSNDFMKEKMVLDEQVTGKRLFYIQYRGFETIKFIFMNLFIIFMMTIT